MIVPYPFLLKSHAQILTLLHYYTIAQHSILEIIKSLNVNKAHGPDNISGRIIELCCNKITLPLSIIFVNIINTGIFPTLWKSGNVTPIHKKDSKPVINNYRPIPLLTLLKYLKRFYF